MTPPEFCTACGQPVEDGAAFCAACGARVASPGGPSVPSSGPAARAGDPARSPPAAGSGPTLSGAGSGQLGDVPSRSLGLEGLRSFLLRNRPDSSRWSYDVLDPSERSLLSISGDPERTIQQLLSFRPPPAPAGGRRALFGPAPPVEFDWTISDARGVEWGSIRGALSSAGFHLNLACSAAGPTGRPLVLVEAQLRALGRLPAVAKSPDGRVLFSSPANALRHDYLLVGPSGAEVGRVHRKWARWEGSYNLELSEGVDPLAALVFTVTVDRAWIYSHPANR